MSRTDAEKYATRRIQYADGHWETVRELIHDSQYCDICDSTDVERGQPFTANGWEGGVKAFFASGPRVVVTAVLCRTHKAKHARAEYWAKRTPVHVYVDAYDAYETEHYYWCQAHQVAHFEPDHS